MKPNTVVIGILYTHDINIRILRLKTGGRSIFGLDIYAIIHFSEEREPVNIHGG